MDDGSEASFEKFEAELAKVTDYIRNQDGNKHAALDVLELLHNIVDEFHSTVHGHVHEDMEVNPASQRPETDPEIMLPVHQYELISSVEVNGRQGVCSEGDYYWVSGSTTLAKYDKDWKLIKTNDDPFKGYTLEVNHIADIDVYNNELYIGAEYFMDGVGKNIQIAVYDADTLELKRTFPFEAESGQLECSGRQYGCAPGLEKRAADISTNMTWRQENTLEKYTCRCLRSGFRELHTMTDGSI